MNFKIDPKCGQKIGSIFEVSFWKRTVTCVTFLSVQILLSKSTNWTKIKEPRHGSSLFKKDQMLKSFPNDLKVQRFNMSAHSEKYYSKNSYLGPEEMPLNKNPVGSTVFHANFIASVADTARIFYLK